MDLKIPRLRVVTVMDVAYKPPEYIREAIQRGDLWVIPAEAATQPKSGLDDDVSDHLHDDDVTQNPDQHDGQHSDTSASNATPEGTSKP